VAFEGDKPEDFIDLVMEMREHEVRKYTLRGHADFTGIRGKHWRRARGAGMKRAFLLAGLVLPLSCAVAQETEGDRRLPEELAITRSVVLQDADELESFCQLRTNTDSAAVL